jgi:hypothetical protein
MLYFLEVRELSDEPTMRGTPHPLVAALIDAVPARSRILLLGVGSGRHIPPLLAANLRIDVLEEDAKRAGAASARFAADDRVRVAHGRYDEPPPFDATYDGALSTHALLHGRPETVAAVLATLASAMRPGAPLHVTLGSRRDPRFGAGTPFDEATRVATTGTEAGIPHAYFDEVSARRLLSDWEILSLEERSAAETAGRWAHNPSELESMVHWFVRAARSAPTGPS